MIGKDRIDLLLQVTTVGFVIATSLAGFDSLGLNEHGLSGLFVTSVGIGESGQLVLLNHFNPSLLQRLTNKHLQDRLHFQVVVEKVRVYILNLDALISALFIRNVSRRGRPVDVVVWLDLGLINHIVAIVEFNPVVHWLLHLLHLLLRVHLLHLLLLLLLRELVVVVAVFSAVHLLLHHLLLLLLLLHFLKPIPACGSCFFLLFNTRGVWLHVDGNN